MKCFFFFYFLSFDNLKVSHSSWDTEIVSLLLHLFIVYRFGKLGIWVFSCVFVFASVALSMFGGVIYSVGFVWSMLICQLAVQYPSARVTNCHVPNQTTWNVYRQQMQFAHVIPLCICLSHLCKVKYIYIYVLASVCCSFKSWRKSFFFVE